MPNSLRPDPQWEMTIADQLSAAVDELLRGSLEAAEAAVREVTVVGPGRTRRQDVPYTTQLSVFRRDSFTCRYCGGRTLFLPTVRLLSDVFPDHLPVDPGWRLDHTHPVYWTLIASADHVTPAIRGGGSTEDNLVTSCWRCNDIKRAWSLQELRWSLLDPPEQKDWDGLSHTYRELCSVLQTSEKVSFSKVPYHRRWLQAFRQLVRDMRSSAAVLETLGPAR